MQASALAILVAAAGLGACAGDGELGGGSDTDVCGAFRELDAFEEPAMTDPAAVRRWADGGRRVLRRVDLERIVDDAPVPDEIASSLDVLDRSLAALQQELDAADDDRAALTRAAEGLADDDAFNDAYASVGRFVGAHCG